jgi:hypothetical protein
MPVVSLRGTAATEDTPGYFGGGDYSNLFDIGTGTFVSGSGNSGPKYLWITGHGFSSYFSSSATINSVTVSANTYTTNAARWESWTASVRVNGVVVGTGATVNMGGVGTFTLTGITAADLLDPDMDLEMRANRGFSALTTSFGIDYADLIVDYTPGYTPTLGGYWGGLTI